MICLTVNSKHQIANTIAPHPDIFLMNWIVSDSTAVSKLVPTFSKVNNPFDYAVGTQLSLFTSFIGLQESLQNSKRVRKS